MDDKDITVRGSSRVDSTTIIATAIALLFVICLNAYGVYRKYYERKYTPREAKAPTQTGALSMG